MATAVNVFEQQAAGYDRYVRENWENMEQWERDQHAAFSSWATDRNVVRRFVTSPVEYAARRSNSRQVVHGGTLRTVSLAYTLILASVYFFPMTFGGAAIALGIVNIMRRRWDHGLVQINLAAGVIISSVYDVSIIEVIVPYFNSLIASIR